MARKEWIAPIRNYDKIQHELVRRNVEPDFNDFHDAISKVFYENKWNGESTEFIFCGVNYGVLDEETYNMLHDLNETQRQEAVYTDIVAIADHAADSKAEKPEYATTEQCIAFSADLSVEIVAEMKVQLLDVKAKIQSVVSEVIVNGDSMDRPG